MEAWAPLVGYEKTYHISSHGRIKRLVAYRGKPGRILKDRNCKGYRIVKLSQFNIQKDHRISRLVALTFIKNPENKPEVNHKDGDPRNNKVSNLEWVTHQENKDHMHEVLGRANLKRKMVKCLNNGKVYKSINHAVKELGLDSGAISRCLSGEYSHTKGYKFERAT